jgi:cytochrome d ubiquinol oxidase subunit I
VDVQPIRAMLNPSTPVMTTHMLLAGYMATGLTIASVYAVGMLRGRRDAYHRRGLALGLVLGLAIAPAQVVVGDAAARLVAQRQPTKLAAMESLWNTTAHAPLTIGGIPLAGRRQTVLGIRIPGALSWLAYGRTDAVVVGLNAVPARDRPNTLVVHIAFQAMVAIGFGMVGLGLWALVGWLRSGRRALPDGRWFLRAVAVAGPAAFVALESGWVVTEVGRQPWIVQGILRTADAVTARGGIVWWLAATVGIYASLGAACVWLLIRLGSTSRNATETSVPAEEVP